MNDRIKNNNCSECGSEDIYVKDSIIHCMYCHSHIPIENKSFKYTEGPWRTCNNGECQCGFVYGPEYIVAVTQQKYDDIQISRETFEANARLIASAPDMLRELINFCDYNCTDCPGKTEGCVETCGLKNAKEIIERATGLSIQEVLDIVSTRRANEIREVASNGI